MSTSINFHWKYGFEFQKLITILESYFPRGQYRYLNHHWEGYGLSYREPDGCLRCIIPSPLINYRLDPNRIERLDWSLFKKPDMEMEWISFGLMYGEGPDDVYNCFRDGRVIRLRCSFDHLLGPYAMVDKLPTAIEKYQQLKGLFKILDADLVDGIYNDDVTIWHESDEEYSHRVLRFSKEGPQLIVPAFENDAHKLDFRPHTPGVGSFVSRIDRPWATAFEPRT